MPRNMKTAKKLSTVFHKKIVLKKHHILTNIPPSLKKKIIASSSISP